MSIRHAPPKTATIVVAAGQSRRFGDANHKLFASLAGQPLILRTLQAVAHWPIRAPIVLVINLAHQHFYEQERRTLEALGVSTLVGGGSERQDSVRAGLAAVPSDTELVLIHDAARPFPQASCIEPLIAAADEAGAAILAVPLNDTLKRVEGNVVRATVDRDHLWHSQTPQAFRLQLLANVMRSSAERPVTDEAALCEQAGIPVRIVAGDRANIKITTPADLVLAEALFPTAHPEARRGS